MKGIHILAQTLEQTVHILNTSDFEEIKIHILPLIFLDFIFYGLHIGLLINNARIHNPDSFDPIVSIFGKHIPVAVDNILTDIVG